MNFCLFKSDFVGIHWVEFSKRARYILNVYFEATDTPENTDQY